MKAWEESLIQVSHIKGVDLKTYGSLAMDVTPLATYGMLVQVDGVYRNFEDRDFGLVLTRYICTVWINDGCPNPLPMCFVFVYLNVNGRLFGAIRW